MSQEKMYGENSLTQVHIPADKELGLGPEVEDGGDPAKIGTQNDARDMWRIGRKQELNVSRFKHSLRCEF
jgi:hypothetical protein